MQYSKQVNSGGTDTFPWVRCLTEFYMAADLVGIQDFPHVTRSLAAFVARPAVGRGLGIPSRS